MEFFFGETYVGLASFGIIHGRREKFNLRLGLGQPNDGLGQIQDFLFFRITQIYWTYKVIRSIHHSNETIDHVLHITERSGLCPIPKDGNRLIPQGLHDEIANHPPIVGVHSGAVGVEDAYNPDVHIILSVIVEKQGFCTPFPFIITGPKPYGIHISPIRLILWMDCRVSVNFARGGLQNLGLHPFG